MMFSVLLIVSVIGYCSAGGEYGAPRITPKYGSPIQRKPEDVYEAASTPYAVTDDSSKYSPFARYGNLPQSVAPSPYRPTPQNGPSPYDTKPPAYGNPSLDDSYQYEVAAPQGGPPSQYESPEDYDQYKGLRPDQVPLPNSAGVHDGGADIPGMGFVKGYPFTQLYKDQEGYEIPGLGFVAGYPFTQIDYLKDAYDIPGLGLIPGYPFSYIGPYVPKSDPKTDGYDNSDNYGQAGPENSYSPQAAPTPTNYAPQAVSSQGRYAPQAAPSPGRYAPQSAPSPGRYAPQDAPSPTDYSPPAAPTPADYSPAADSYSQQAMASPADYAVPKNIRVQYAPSAQTGYLSQTLSSYPQGGPSDPYAVKDAQDSEQDAYADPAQRMKFAPVRYQVGYSRQPAGGEYPQQSAPVAYPRHTYPGSLAASHIPPNVHLPKFIMNPPTVYKGSAGLQYQ